MKDNKIDKFKELIKEADAIVVGGALSLIHISEPTRPY